MVRNQYRISLIVQEGFLKKVFPSSDVQRKGEKSLTWLGALKPSPLSCTYEIKIQYFIYEKIKVFVTNPVKLPLAEGRQKLPHVYSTINQELCLFYPGYREWNARMLYTRTIIPWACEWLVHYELWVCTGKWAGGGIEHSSQASLDNDSREKIVKQQ